MTTVLPEGYAFVTELGEIDLDATHAYLTRSYWAAGIPFETVRRALANSFCVAITYQGAQVAFARLVSDRATFAYLADVYVLEEHRGRSEEHTSELQSLMRISYAVFCLKKKKNTYYTE